MYQCCYLRFECLHNQFSVILYVILMILFGCGSRVYGWGLIGISPRASKWLETALHTLQQTIEITDLKPFFWLVKILEHCKVLGYIIFHSIFMVLVVITFTFLHN